MANNIDSLELKLSKANGGDSLELLVQLSKAYWTVQPAKGLYYANEAVESAEQYNDENQKAKALLYGGVNLWFLGTYDEAIDYYHKSLAIARKLNDEKLCAFNLNNLGMVNSHLKHYAKAIDNYSESALIMEKAGDEIEYAKIKNNIAELYMRTGKYDEALKLHLSVLDIIENSNEQVFLIWLYNDIGLVYKKKNNYSRALEYFYSSLNLSQKINNSLGKSKSMNLIGEVFMQQKRYEQAKKFFLEGLKYAKETDAIEQINEAYKNISEYYSAIADYKSSLEYFKLYKQFSDSIINEQKIRSIIEMQARYEWESKENENRLLRKSVELDELTIQKNKSQHRFLIILLLLTMALIILTYSRLKIKKRRNKELSEKNVLINQQKNQLSDSLKRHQELNKLLNQQNEEIQSSKREIEEVNRELSESNVTKDRFISIIGHDLRNPFHSMMGFSHLLNYEYDDFTTEERKKFIGIINQGLHNTYNLLDNLLNWAASQRGTLSFDPQKIKLFQLADSAYKLLKPAANDKSITISNLISESLYAYGDANMISTIFGNLISNAIKFTPKEGEVSIEADTNSTDGYILISVKDNGRGMSEEVVSSLFNFGGNFSTPGTQNEAGTGLGLVLCKEFVEKHNGQIWVESKEEIGSTFYFTIPCTTED